MDGLRIADLPLAMTIDSDALVEISQGGLSYAATTTQVSRAARSIDNPAYLEDFGKFDTPHDVAETFYKAALEIGARGGGQIYLPPATLVMGPFPGTAIAEDEGAGLTLTEAMSKISWVGVNGRSVVTPMSNKIEMFCINGAARSRFVDISFDNIANGVLEGTFKPDDRVPGGGVAGMGNAANSAISQHTGADLRVTGCEFWSFNTCIRYTGYAPDDAVLAGVLIVDDVLFEGSCFGILANQPRLLRFTNSRYNNGFSSVNAVGQDPIHDPGHGLYLANRGGGHPDIVFVHGITGRNNTSYLVQVRKGKVVSVTDIDVLDCHRGVIIENAQLATGSNYTIRLKNINPDDAQADGLRVINNGNYEFSNIVINRAASGAFGALFSSSTKSPDIDISDDDDTDVFTTWSNVRGRVRGLKVFDDVSAQNSRPYIKVVDQVDCVFEEPIGHLMDDTPGTAAIAHAVVELETCTRVRVIKPKKWTAEVGTPVGADRLVVIDAASVDCYVEVDRNCLDVDPTDLTVVNPSPTTRVEWTDSGPASARTADFTVVPQFNEYICNKGSTDMVVTLPSPAVYKGRTLRFVSWRRLAVNSASSNVAALGFGSASNRILPSGNGRWAELTANGTLWDVVRSGGGDGTVSSSGTSEPFGYVSGWSMGNAVVQTPTKSAAVVTLNRPTGQITISAASLAAGASVSFQLVNSVIGVNDLMHISHKAVGNLGDYQFAYRCAAGSATIRMTNVSAGALAEAVVLQYAVIKGAID